MSNPIEFYFDFSSPYGYLASEKIDELAARFARKVLWRPVLLGVIFRQRREIARLKRATQRKPEAVDVVVPPAV